MMRDENSSAYDFSLFEDTAEDAVKIKQNNENPKSKNNIIQLPSNSKAEKTQRRRHNPFVIFGVSVLVIIAAIVLATIVQSNVRLNELNESLVNTEAEITQQKNLEAQYQVIVDSKLSMDTIQKYAEEDLGMTKAQKDQKIFLTLTDGDVGNVVTEDESNNIFDTLSRAFRGLWS